LKRNSNKTDMSVHLGRNKFDGSPGNPKYLRVANLSKSPEAAKGGASREWLTGERLRELLSYDPMTGEFRWLVASARNIRAGAVAGTINNKGYRKIGFGRRRYRASHLAHLYMIGDWPRAEIDHANLDHADDRWSNLREATRSQNTANTPARANNASGYKGVGWHKHYRKWRARIKVDGKQYELGLFSAPDAAHAVYAVAAKRYFGEFARLA
jgi:hypothetical protein